jgi:hypothetical protein
MVGAKVMASPSQSSETKDCEFESCRGGCYQKSVFRKQRKRPFFIDMQNICHRLNATINNWISTLVTLQPTMFASTVQNDQMSLLKNRPKYGPTHFLLELLVNFHSKKRPKILVHLANFRRTNQS